MILRDLTDEEIEQIKKCKDEANKVIRVQRKKLTEAIKSRHKYRPTFRDMELRSLEKQLEAHTTITGRPVIIKDGYNVITLNYDLLKKYERSLDKGNFYSQWSKIEEDHLVIQYGKQGQSGTIELFELPAHQVDLLDGLPIVKL